MKLGKTKKTPPQEEVAVVKVKPRVVKTVKREKPTDLEDDDDDGLDFSSISPKRLRLPAPTRRSVRGQAPKEEEPDSDEPSSVRLLPGVSKRTIRRLNTMFGQRSDSIIDLLETTDTDGAASLITRTMLQTLVDVLPVVERGVRRSKGARGVMPMNQVISQIREMCHDLQAYKDRSLLGQNLVDRTIRPAFLDLAVQVSTMFVEMDSFCKTRMDEKDFERFHDFSLQLKRSLADYIHKQYNEISSTIIKSM